METSDLIAAGALMVSVLAYLQAASASRRQGTIFGISLEINLHVDEVTGLSSLILGRVSNIGQSPIKLEKIVLLDNNDALHDYYLMTLIEENSPAPEWFISTEKVWEREDYWSKNTPNIYFLEYVELQQNDGMPIILHIYPESGIKSISFYDTTGRIHKVRGVKRAYRKFAQDNNLANKVN